MAKYKNLWRVVRRLLIERHAELVEEAIRDGFYMVGDWLAPLIGKEITQEEYDHFATNEKAYAVYRDDLWVSLEQKQGLKRPEAKPYGTLYDRGRERPISELGEVWSQARGFVFTETIGDGEKLKALSNLGWTIVAGGGYAGFPTRQIRQLLKEDGRDVLAFHDGDRSGEGIYRALGLKTRRTKHLDIALGDRVKDLGLDERDARALKLRSRPEPPKYKGLPRWETSALSVLKTRWGVENPKLAYVVAKMLALGVRISPTSLPRKKLLKAELAWRLRSALNDIVYEVAEKRSEIEGEAVDVEVPDPKGIEIPGLKKALDRLALELAGEARWAFERNYERAAARLTDRRILKALEGRRGART